MFVSLTSHLMILENNRQGRHGVSWLRMIDSFLIRRLSRKKKIEKDDDYNNSEQQLASKSLIDKYNGLSLPGS